jgi:hypothetical protein
MDNWQRAGKIIRHDGTYILYENSGPFQIESRRKQIPHANGSGTWDHTSYFVIRDGEDLKECFTLKDAKEYVKKLEMEVELYE